MDVRAHSPGSERTPRLAMYCLPHAGGGAAAYVRWRRSLPATVHLVPVELPGHGSRLAEPPVQRLDTLVGQVVNRVRHDGGSRIALLGHSFGALVAFEVARRLTALGAPPEVLLLCGRNGPREAATPVAPHDLPDDAFLAAIRRLGGIPTELSDHPDVVRAYLPALRADLHIADNYRRGDGDPLDVPIAVFGGRDDVLTCPAGLLGWERETSATFELTLLPGTHFFTRTNAFLQALRCRLDRAMAEAP